MQSITVAYTIHKRLFLVMHTKDNPSDEEWTQYIDFTLKNIGQINSGIILTEGGGPNTMQRGILNDALEARNIKQKVAVVTLSRMVRGIVTALSWFNPNVRAFNTMQIPAALAYLEIPTTDHDSILREIRGLRIKLGLPPV